MSVLTATRPAAAPTLLPLRQEIAIFPGPSASDGSPTWTLHDPACNRFYRLGWLEFEILSRWDCADAELLIGRVNAETSLAIDAQDVEDLGRFLFAYDLLRSANPRSTAGMVEKAKRRRETWGQWLLHNYLFLRVPLVRPDRFLAALYPYVRFVHSRAFALVILSVGLAGLYLIERQWDVFLDTFVDLFTISGAVSFGVTLFCLKIVHELGHALTAKRFDCRVPTMGVAFLVMVPMLYTDVNDSWRLTSRRQRLSIGLAGVTAEIGCAALAAFAWGFLPAGPLRSAAFLVATSTWVTTLLINLSPFMRYDGYYVLSDWLETPNLHTRAFALAQWRMRETLLGLGDEPPEDFSPGRRRFLVCFAFLTWIYRFSLFLGIAAIVYHFAIKILGIAMMVVEIGFFVVRPVFNEARTWWRRRGDIHLNPRTLFTTAGAIVLIALLVAPWRSGIEAPAMLKSQRHVDVFVPEFGARVTTLGVTDGSRVNKGDVLMRMVSPDLDNRIAGVRSDLDILAWQMNAQGMDSTLLANSWVTEQEYLASLAELRGLLDQKEQLDIAAPFTGEVVDIAEGLDSDTWAAPKSRLLSVIDPSSVVVEAYVDEADLARIRPGIEATFVPEADSRAEVTLRVVEIAAATASALPDPALASIFGGPITVRATKQNELVPDRALYRVTLAPVGAGALLTRVLRGHVVLRGEPVSVATSVWRVLLGVVIREGGA